MKKIFKISLYAVLLAVIMPFTLFLSGCGATPSKEALGVYFESQIYDEETGYAVFEVDKNVNTKLSYKVNPSSWGSYAVTYAIKECSAQNRSRFTLKDGKIKVESDLFEEIKIEIYINSYVDTCIVKLKKYPTSMFMYDVNGQEVTSMSVTINAYGSYTISPYGRFMDSNGVSYVQPLLEYDYNFTVTTSDETIISVPNSNRLKVSSARKNIGSAKVIASLKDATGKVVHSVEVTINVVLNASSSFVIVSGHDSFVNNGSSVEINLSDLEMDEDGNGILNYSLYVLSEDGRYIDSGVVEVFCTISDTKYAIVDNVNSCVLIEPATVSETSFKVSLWTNLIVDNGSAYSISFDVKINY